MLQSVRSIFIDAETTPNPHAMKFLPGRTILPETHGSGMHFSLDDRDGIKKSPLAKSLFAIDGVAGVFLGREFISVTKDQDEVWHLLKPQIFSNILDFFASGKDVIMDGPEVSDTTVLDTDSEVVAMIKELMETRVRPSVQEDGGDIFFMGFDDIRGIVKVKLAGSCVGCPSSSVTLRNGVERMLCHYIPEVLSIEEVVDDDVVDTEAKLEYHPDPVAA
jgi:Fe-S cluster biogenesis protein NfuA